MANLKYLDCDFYTIEQHLDGKYVHVGGYFYFSDDNGNGKDYRWLEYCGFYLPIDLFPNNYEEKYDEMVDNSRHTIYDLSEERCERLMKECFDRTSNPSLTRYFLTYFNIVFQCADKLYV